MEEMGCLQGRVAWLESGSVAQPRGNVGFGLAACPALPAAPQDQERTQPHLGDDPRVRQLVTAPDKPSTVGGQSRRGCPCAWEP